MSEQEEKESNPKGSRLRSVMVALVVAVVLSGVIVMALVRFDYPGRPMVYNTLGLNPTVQWVGKNAPDFQVPDLRTGKPVSLQAYQGKVILLDFWATWCGSCMKQMPIINKLHQDPALSKTLQILTINMKDPTPPATIVQFLQQRGYTFPVLKGNEAIVKTYGVWFFPALILIAPNGKVFFSAAELHDETKIRKMIALAAKQTK
jgi:thiol-disulfide isomerase/thioredoxin